LQRALALVQADVAILTGAAALDAPQASEALEAGLAVILDQPHLVDLVPLARLARDRDRPLALARVDPGQPRLQRLLAKVGVVSHVSYVDRRPPSAAGDGTGDNPYGQLASFALDHFESLRRLFGQEPVRIMARCGRLPWGEGATTEAFLELEYNTHVHYYGSTAASREEHSVWIEGSRGSLCMDGPGIWWRQRGWPRFVPWRWRLRSGADPERRWADGATSVLTEVARALTGGPSARAAKVAATRPLALLGSAIASDRAGRVVDLGEWLAGSATAAGHEPAGA
jgi:predicted dehydrogenase